MRRATSQHAAMPRDIIALGDLEIDRDARRIRKSGRAVDVSDLGFALLERLARSAPEPVSTEELTNSVWKASHVADHTIAQRVNIVRRALGDDGEQKRYIRSVRGKGYAIPIAPRSSRRRLPFRSVAVIASLLLAGLAIFLWRANDPGTADVQAALYNPEAGSLRLDNPDRRLAEPARANVGDQSILIVGLPDHAALAGHTEAISLLCRLSENPTAFSTAVEPSLANYLKEGALVESCSL